MAEPSDKSPLWHSTERRRTIAIMTKANTKAKSAKPDDFGEKSLISVKLVRSRGWNEGDIEEDWRRLAALTWRSPLTEVDREVHARGHAALRAYIEALARSQSSASAILETHSGRAAINTSLSLLRQFARNLSMMNRSQIALMAEIIANGQRAAHRDKERSIRLTPRSLVGQLLMVGELAHEQGPAALASGRSRGHQPGPILDRLLDELTATWAVVRGKAPTAAKGDGEFLGFFRRLIETSRITLGVQISMAEDHPFFSGWLPGPTPLDEPVDLEKLREIVRKALPRALKRYKQQQSTSS